MMSNHIKTFLLTILSFQTLFHPVSGQDLKPETFDLSPPEENRFTIEVLEQKIFEPMELAVLPDSRVIFVERRGGVKMYDPELKITKVIANLNVYLGSEDGLLGATSDPDFVRNNWLYFFYSPFGDKAVQRISRFTLSADSLDMKSEKVLLEIPLLRACCHSGGSLEFGPDGNLFISVGDNTNPSASSGFSPIDERPDRLSFDAQKSAANTNDLRGKILRIKPNADGSYAIPDGNLFPKDGSKGRPEIYIMGNRNPFRISVDNKTGYLYWGEVGPDAGLDSLHRGPKGHDEINQARKAGNFGWPYFVANNKPYVDFDFAANGSGQNFDSDNPVNESVNNTGAKLLPPAQPAFIWYPYLESPEFPEVQKGGRTAMAGPVFRSENFKNASFAFPEYYDGKLFIYDWMRNWIMLVTMHENGDYRKMEPFLPSTNFSKPVDMHFGPDGSLYILEYGTFWKSLNDNSRLIKVQFHKNNRKPSAKITADKTVGAVPLTVKLSAKSSFDRDKGDKLSFAWKLKNEQVISKEPVLNYTFEKPGVHQITLSVKDIKGETAETFVDIKAGNEPPEISIETRENKSFYWENESVNYSVRVRDLEDGQGMNVNKNAKVTFEYLSEGKDLVLLTTANPLDQGNGKLLTKNGCAACHAYNKRTVGPAFQEISLRYQGKNKAEELIAKVSNGGNGNWGEVAMAAHPQISKAEIGKMVDYILTLSDVHESESLPAQGIVKTPAQSSKAGVYFLNASYTDKGANELESITSRATIVLKYPTLMAYDCDTSHAVMIRKADGRARFTQNGAYVVFKNTDLTGIQKLSLKAFAYDNSEGALEIRLGSENGKLISSKFLNPGSKWVGFDFLLEPVKGFQSLYFVYKTASKKIGIWQTFDISAITFLKNPGS